MMPRLLHLFVCAAAVITVAYPARAVPEKIQYSGDAKPGTIVVQTGERSLYLVTGKERAFKYSVGVGRSGQQWFGTTRIASKHIKPAWKPPVSLRGNRSPEFYIERGSPKNPMGAAALVLVDHELAIHGTILARSGALYRRGAPPCQKKRARNFFGGVLVGPC